MREREKVSLKYRKIKADPVHTVDSNMYYYDVFSFSKQYRLVFTELFMSFKYLLIFLELRQKLFLQSFEVIASRPVYNLLKDWPSQSKP